MRWWSLSGMLALAALMPVDAPGASNEIRQTLVGIDPVLMNRPASALAPRGVYYRTVGHVSTESPTGDSQMVDVDGHVYYYERGVFWVQQGSRYVVVPAPIGALVKALPERAEILAGQKTAMYYWYGAFFGEQDGKYEVLKPPAGVAVSYLPEGYKQERVGGATAYTYGSTCFEPVVAQGTIKYQVAECPEGARVPEGGGASARPDGIRIIGACENAFTLFVNGKQALQSADWNDPVRAFVELRDGDVITATASDKDVGGFCGFAVAGLEGGRIIFSSTDFFYSLQPPPDWQTSRSLEGFKPADPSYAGLTHTASKRLDDPRVGDVWSSEHAQTVYFKLVYGALKPAPGAAAPLPTVTITATDATATEKPLTTGTFALSRTGSTAAVLTVYYTMGGSTTSGSDYTALPGRVDIPRGASTATITVTPIDDKVVEGGETAVLTLSADAAYAVGAPGRATITLASEDEIILDNAPVGTSGGGRTFTGTWCTSSVAGHYGTDSLYSCRSGTDTYRYTPTLPTAGSYDVYVRWTAHPGRSTAVPISVTHSAGTTTKTYNQEAGGGVWVLHGTYSFNAGTGGSVQISDATGQASVDAVRFVPAL
jgi:hypothetical protein